MPGLRNALRALDNSGADPGVIKEVFAQAEAVYPEFRGDVYKGIAEKVTFGSGSNGLTTTQVLRDVATNIANGPGFDDSNALPPSPTAVLHGEVVARERERNDHFRETSGPLENRALPYRTQASWQEGMEDLERLVLADPTRGDFAFEGSWVYAPEDQTWYSLGGRTVARDAMGNVNHRAVQYDASALSETPVLVHLHPEVFPYGQSNYGHVLPTNHDYDAVADMIDNAQGPITPRSFIVHPFGVTEFTYPQDTDAIRQAAGAFEAASRNTLIDAHGSPPDIDNLVREIGVLGFINGIIQGINDALPNGFGIKFYPKDT
jgi:hypothetical protein